MKRRGIQPDLSHIDLVRDTLYVIRSSMHLDLPEKEENLTFYQALCFVKNGIPVTRQSWPRGQLYFDKDQDLCLFTGDHTLMLWTPSKEDAYANDWKITDNV